MGLRNTALNYGSVSKILHWLIFIFVTVMIIVGNFMDDIPDKLIRGTVFMAHKWLGLFVLTLMILRVIWALLNPKPQLPYHLPKFQQFGAHAMHVTLYLLLIAMPLTGWIMSSAAGKAPALFGYALAFPGIPVDKPLSSLNATLHFYLGWTIVVLVSLHSVAALKHHFIDKNNVLKRMLPN